MQWQNGFPVVEVGPPIASLNEPTPNNQITVLDGNKHLFLFLFAALFQIHSKYAIDLHGILAKVLILSRNLVTNYTYRQRRIHVL